MYFILTLYNIMCCLWRNNKDNYRMGDAHHCSGPPSPK